jgi:hypothetical protein
MNSCTLARHVAGMGEKTIAYRDLVGKHVGQIPLGRCNRKQEVKVKLSVTSQTDTEVR